MVLLTSLPEQTAPFVHLHLIYSDPHWYPARQALQLHPSKSIVYGHMALAYPHSGIN